MPEIPPMRYNEMNVAIVDDLTTLGRSIYFYIPYSDGSRDIYNIDTGGRFIVTRVQRGEVCKPTIYGMDFSMIHGFVNAAKEIGVRPDRDAGLEGELKATKLHLADVRRMLMKMMSMPPEDKTEIIIDE